MEKKQKVSELENLLQQQEILPPHLLSFSKLRSTVDKEGFTYHITLEDENKIYLFVPEMDKRLCLGRIVIGKNNLLYHKFEDERAIHRQSDSWSINYKIFEHVNTIYYETLKYDYQISKERAEEFGFTGYASFNEKKLYIPLKYWDKRRKLIDKKEKYKRTLIGDSWYNQLKHVMESEHMRTIMIWLRKERVVRTVYPEEKVIFRAFKLCTFEHTKVVIIGQDPYHDGSADGLAFSFNQTAKRAVPKSLNVIIKEVERDCYNGLLLDRSDGDLSVWAKQGVLLLNTVLTVEKRKPKSHWDIGWRRFTRKVVADLYKSIQPIVFICWGKEAQELFKEARELAGGLSSGLVLNARHPAADLYEQVQKPDYPNTFAGCSHFSQANEYLKKHNRKEIIW